MELSVREQREANLTFIKWDPTVKISSWKEQEDRGQEQEERDREALEMVFDNNPEGSAPLGDFNRPPEL